jgi:hypothetical protein
MDENDVAVTANRGGFSEASTQNRVEAIERRGPEYDGRHSLAVAFGARGVSEQSKFLWAGHRLEELPALSCGTISSYTLSSTMLLVTFPGQNNCIFVDCLSNVLRLGCGGTSTRD